MRILFLHQNAPGQFRHLAPFLAGQGHEVVFLSEKIPPGGGKVRWLRYKTPKRASASTHHYLHRMESAVRRGQAVARACLALAAEGFAPDLVIAHAGWGESMFLRDVLPRAVRILSYCEMFYRAEAQDTGYIDETQVGLDGRCRLRAWNADLLLALEAMDLGLSPTAWQRAQHPAMFQPRICVVHDGVDTKEVTPNGRARFVLSDGGTLTGNDEVVTYVARNLEPVRGFAALMRALPELCRRRPDAHIVICGGDGVSYGRMPDRHRTWREQLTAEVPVDPGRVHFVGVLSRHDYLTLLQISALHLYLTAPFVLSWSCIEALAAGCIVLGSDVVPVREVVSDGETGFLTDGRDPDAIARRAADLLARRASLGGVRQQARAMAVRRYDVQICLAAQGRLIERLAA